MTRLKALKDLKAKVEAGNIEHHHWSILGGTMPEHTWSSIKSSYHGSLDAAKTLHDAVLPDVRVQGVWETTEGSWVAQLCLRAHAVQIGYAPS
jgi:hypothetical protein